MSRRPYIFPPTCLACRSLCLALGDVLLYSIAYQRFSRSPWRRRNFDPFISISLYYTDASVYRDACLSVRLEQCGQSRLTAFLAFSLFIFPALSSSFFFSRPSRPLVLLPPSRLFLAPSSCSCLVSSASLSTVFDFSRSLSTRGKLRRYEEERGSLVTREKGELHPFLLSRVSR